MFEQKVSITLGKGILVLYLSAYLNIPKQQVVESSNSPIFDHKFWIFYLQTIKQETFYANTIIW